MIVYKYFRPSISMKLQVINLLHTHNKELPKGHLLFLSSLVHHCIHH